MSWSPPSPDPSVVRHIQLVKTTVEKYSSSRWTFWVSSIEVSALLSLLSSCRERVTLAVYVYLLEYSLNTWQCCTLAQWSTQTLQHAVRIARNIFWMRTVHCIWAAQRGWRSYHINRSRMWFPSMWGSLRLAPIIYTHIKNMYMYTPLPMESPL